MSSEKRLFLLDSFALIFRAYFAFNQNPRITSYGLNTSAVFGFTNTLLDLLNREKPTHIAAIFDSDGQTERHTDFADYKANREEAPEDLTSNMPHIFNILEAFNIPILKKAGYEADDIVGTIAKQAAEKGYTVYMMTMDKDFGQLVDKNVFIYKPARAGGDFEILGVEEVKKRWEIDDPLKVIDILGLMGDAIDNIPGIPGIGEKTAKKLVAEFGSIENLLNNTDKLKGKQKENVENNKDIALLSKKLATIITDVPIEWTEKDFELEAPNRDRLKQIFAELEFKTLGKRILGEEIPVNTKPDAQGDLFASPQGAITAEKEPESNFSAYKTIHDTPHIYHLADSQEKISELIGILEGNTSICFDTETTSLNELDAEIVGLSFAVNQGEAWYVPVPEDQEKARQILMQFKGVLENEQIEKTGQNIKYDLMVLRNYDIHLKGKLLDTMLMHYIIEPEQKHGMDDMSRIYLKYEPVSIETLIGKKGKDQKNFRSVEVEKAKEYAAEDADITLQLRNHFLPELTQRNGEKVYHGIEAPLIPVLADMETTGIRVDKDFLSAYSKELENEALEVEKEIYKQAGTTFNIASPKQLGEVLFDLMKLDPKAKKTKTGQYKTDEEVLQNLSSEGHAIAKHILDYRQIQKLKSTYIDILPQLVHPRTQRVHTSFNQAVAATGRLSSNNPNLQNIPIRTDKGREVRKAFIPAENNLLLSADYSQIELRVIAAISKEQNMVEDFRNGLDIHSATASRVFGVGINEVDKEMRRRAKMVNFGIIYGISAFGLSQRLEIPRKEGQEIINAYFEQYPGIKRYMNESINFAKEHGYVETVMGRRRYIRDINSANFTVRGFAERNAINAPIQGTAADMIKLAMIRIYDEMRRRKLQSKMILQVHDELLFDVIPSEKEELIQLVTEGMRDALPLEVPIEVEAGTGNNWLEAH